MKQIATILNEDNISAPIVRRKQLKGEVYNKLAKLTDQTIRNILKQQIYTGDMVQGKTKSYSHKIKKRIPLPREQWTIVTNTHEAIINRETFETVQDMLKLKSKPMTKKNNTPPSVLNGLLICSECGKKMQRTIVSKNNIDHYYYVCSTYKNIDKKLCTSHSINESTVIDVILITLNTLIDNMIDVEDAMKQNNRKVIDKAIKKTKSSLGLIEIEFEKTQKAKSCIYVDFVNGDINIADYQYMVKEFTKKCSSLESRKKKLEQDIVDYMNNNLFNNKALNVYTKYKGINELERKTALSLIKSITIDSGNNINIKFKFEDEIKKYQRSL